MQRMSCVGSPSGNGGRRGEGVGGVFGFRGTVKLHEAPHALPSSGR